jgi:deazaflavin-dependent oxidoreductase (nitroreductase family)
VAANTRLYRLSGGRRFGRMGKAPILLLHHVGRKSGKERVTPVLYLADGADLVVVGSKGGTDKTPAWFHNLVAAPETTVEVGREKRRVRPRRATDDERDALWPRLVDMHPAFAEYQSFTDRTIPVAVLEPAG